MTMRDLNYYKALNYRMSFFYEKTEDRWYVEFPELPGCMADGATREEALQAALGVKDDWLETNLESGRGIPEPQPEIEFSGRFLLRVPKTLHMKLANEAQRDGTSINRLAIQFLAEAIERRQNMKTVSDAFGSYVSGKISGAFSIFNTLGEGYRKSVFDPPVSWLSNEETSIVTISSTIDTESIDDFSRKPGRAINNLLAEEA